MAKYLSLLRGINVSGQKKILMKDLKSLFEALGFKNVQTHIQSGNAIFDSKSSKNLSKKIEEKITEKYGFHVSVIIRTPDEMAELIKKNPFVKNKNADQKKLYLTFLVQEPEADRINKLHEIKIEAEKFIIDKKEIFTCYPNGYGNAKFNNNFIEKKLNVAATTRNWKVVNELFVLLKA